MTVYILYGLAALLLFLGLLLLFFVRKKFSDLALLLREFETRKDQLRRELDAEKREAHLRLKDELYKKRLEFDLESKKERAELERLQQKLHQKYDALEKRELRLEDTRRELQQKEKSLLRSSDILRSQEQKNKMLFDDLIQKLEHVGSMTRDEARSTLIQMIESEVRHTQEKWIQKVEEESRNNAKEKAIQIVVSAMQRYTAEQVAPSSSGVVHLPNDEMKGRIIGKEGRNIKALEMATGMEFVIGDTPEVITISGFNPIRRGGR